MGVALLVCRLALALVLVVAAVAKLADRAGARRSLEGLGVPTGLAPAAAVALPLIELGVALALVPVASAWPAALAAAGLLAAFTLVVAVAVVRGVDADCHCFGELSSKPVGWGTLARNLVLLAAAALVAVAGSDDAGASAPAWLGWLALVGAVTVNFAFLFQLMQQNGRLWAELEELRPKPSSGASTAPALGTPAPRFALPDLAGDLVALDDLLDGERRVLLVFSDPACGACDPLLPEIARRQRDPDADPRPVLISFGSAEDIRAKVSDHGIDQVLLGGDFELARSFGVGGLPAAIVLDADGRVAGEPVHGTNDATALLDESFRELKLVRGG